VQRFPFSDEEFKTLCELVTKHSGIQLYDRGKRNMVYSRIARRLRVLEMSSFAEYLLFLQTEFGCEQEFSHCINALTTNLTAFFREAHHFTFLETTALPLLMRRNAATKRIRIWSSGCSSGEEAYSIAMTVSKVVPDDWDVRILATDIDSNMVEHGANAIYSDQLISNMDVSLLQQFFLKGSASGVRVKDRLRSMVSFRRLNLLDTSWPMKGPFDIIFCRNVIIYFDNDTQEVLFNRYAEIMHDDSYMFIGHSEHLQHFKTPFRLIGQTVYDKR